VKKFTNFGTHQQTWSPHLLVFGLNHRTAPLAVRERVAVFSRELPDAVQELRQAVGVEEAVILSTCNRFECYAVSSDPAVTFQAVGAVLASRSHLAPETFSSNCYCLTDRDAVSHLFRVTAGLDSMVLGESEIATQVKHAYETANGAGTVGPGLNRLFQKALHAAKLIRTKTRIAEGAASIGSVVVDLAKQHFGDGLRGRTVLLWGAGKAAETTARHLIKQGIQKLWIVNRTPAKAQALASLCEGGWLSWEQAIAHLASVDLAIVCTEAPHFVIDEDDLASVIPQRQGRPLVLVDLSVPRNIDPAIRPRPGVRVYHLDELKQIADRGLASRQQELARCEALIHEQVEYLMRSTRGASDEEKRACHDVGVLLAVSR